MLHWSTHFGEQDYVRTSPSQLLGSGKADQATTSTTTAILIREVTPDFILQ
jgi:hypothetical protein